MDPVQDHEEEKDLDPLTARGKPRIAILMATILITVLSDQLLDPPSPSMSQGLNALIVGETLSVVEMSPSQRMRLSLSPSEIG